MSTTHTPNWTKIYIPTTSSLPCITRSTHSYSCACDFRLLIQNCGDRDERDMWRNLYILIACTNFFVAICELVTLVYRIKKKQQTLWIVKASDVGYIRPKPVEVSLIKIGLTYLIPRSLNYPFNSATSFVKTWTPSPFLIDLFTLFLIVAPIITLNLFAFLSGHFANKGDATTAKFYRQARYGFWCFYLVLLTGALIYFSNRLGGSVENHFRNVKRSTLQSNASNEEIKVEQVKEDMVKVKKEIFTLSITLISLALISFIYIFARTEIHSNYTINILFGLFWLLLFPIIFGTATFALMVNSTGDSLVSLPSRNSHIVALADQAATYDISTNSNTPQQSIRSLGSLQSFGRHTRLPGIWNGSHYPPSIVSNNNPRPYSISSAQEIEPLSHRFNQHRYQWSMSSNGSNLSPMVGTFPTRPWRGSGLRHQREFASEGRGKPVGNTIFGSDPGISIAGVESIPDNSTLPHVYQPNNRDYRHHRRSSSMPLPKTTLSDIPNDFSQPLKNMTTAFTERFSKLTDIDDNVDDIVVENVDKKSRDSAYIPINGNFNEKNITISHKAKDHKLKLFDTQSTQIKTKEPQYQHQKPPGKTNKDDCDSIMVTTETAEDISSGPSVTSLPFSGSMPIPSVFIELADDGYVNNNNNISESKSNKIKNHDESSQFENTMNQDTSSYTDTYTNNYDNNLEDDENESKISLGIEVRIEDLPIPPPRSYPDPNTIIGVKKLERMESSSDPQEIVQGNERLISEEDEKNHDGSGCLNTTTTPTIINSNNDFKLNEHSNHFVVELNSKR
ncbi:hypothetical protein G9A89_009103 [Geosiphon pyriformis]|nr:hypothetical protein G9A89_009103 [Geosiphon pyriformis]